MPELTLQNLVDGLKTFADRYHALDVFIDDLAELRRPAPAIAADGTFQIAGEKYRLQLFPDQGVARITRHVGTTSAAPAAAGAAIGALMGSAVSPKREGAAVGLLLGLLVGAALGASATEPKGPRRVFALCFDPESGQWRAYDGGLVRWMKSSLAVPDLSLPGVVANARG